MLRTLFAFCILALAAGGCSYHDHHHERHHDDWHDHDRGERWHGDHDYDRHYDRGYYQ